ncbi:uncharacterized protein LOC112190983 [Rosa chinensis]|uniref:uncharacterized protein LOC112190983 n=1 Tax=Rosa chinensis TaxID=74649 RepID=UPI000D08F262|nr:uncharacterized protein LOC112190983 [Rosa chinensis]
MRKKPQSQLLICTEHDMQQPLYRFIVTALITDETDEASAIIKGKQGEELFGTTCEDLILNKNHDNPNILPQEILRIEGQIKLLELEIGTAQNVIVKGIHEDIRGLNPTQRIQPSSSTADNIQPSSSTPDKVETTKKRNNQSSESDKQLFKTYPTKNLKMNDILTDSLEDSFRDSSEDLM